jgi:hypothetical protein
MGAECLGYDGLRETRALHPFGALVGGEYGVGLARTRAFGHGEYVSDTRMFLQDRLKLDACGAEVSNGKITGINAGQRIGRDSRYMVFEALL